MFKNTYVIGDIHGCLDDLNNLLGKIDIENPDTQIIFVGDYIDRGPKIVEVVQKVKSLEEKYGGDKVVCLMGNHDYEYFILGNPYLAAGSTIPQYMKCSPDMLIEHKEWAKTLRFWYEDEKNFYLHGGLTPGKHPSEEKTDNLIWLRGTETQKHQKCLIVGHTPEGRNTARVYYADGPTNPITGINVDGARVYGGFLTAAVLLYGVYQNSIWSDTGFIGNRDADASGFW